MNARMDRGGKRRTLVVGVNWLGDTVMSLPALAALREVNPEEEIHVGAPRHLAALIRLAAPVDRVWGWPEGGSTFHRVRMWREGGYRRVILFPNSFRSAWISWLAGVPERWGYDGQWRRWLLNRPIPSCLRAHGLHQSETYLRIARTLGWKGSEPPRVDFRIPAPVKGWARDRLASVKDGGPVVGICPGAAYGPAKRWAPERFAQAGQILRDRHGATVVLMGSGKEREAIAEMARAVGPGALDLSGETDLETLAALLEACQVVICNDSGPMHLAAALGTPVVALFGSTDFVATAPMGPHRIVRTEAECSPCLRRECPENTYRCLDGISTEQVVSVTEEFLRERGALQGSRS